MSEDVPEQASSALSPSFTEMEEPTERKTQCANGELRYRDFSK
ncbi:MAG TPA: hypothetical protein VM580_08090 [Labilithrix sp.]|jgi:hypothetical protein|nr:hypothetical protein [Labilithrix sp.]